jgi:hypothetical protein
VKLRVQSGPDVFPGKDSFQYSFDSRSVSVVHRENVIVTLSA